MGPVPPKFRWSHPIKGSWQPPLYLRLVIFEIEKNPEKSQCLGAHIAVFACGSSMSDVLLCVGVDSDQFQCLKFLGFAIDLWLVE